MAQQTIKDLKKGEFFTRKPIDYPTENQVWVRGSYDRSTKTYSCFCYGDVCRELFLRGTAKAFTDFVF